MLDSKWKSLDKSWVSMEVLKCPVCTKDHSHKAGLLLDRRLRPSLERETLTGWGLCEDCSNRMVEYAALVVCDESKSEIGSDQTTKLDGAYRTGEILWFKRDKWTNIFNMPIPKGGIAFIGLDGAEKLKSLMPKG